MGLLSGGGLCFPTLLAPSFLQEDIVVLGRVEPKGVKGEQRLHGEELV